MGIPRHRLLRGTMGRRTIRMATTGTKAVANWKGHDPGDEPGSLLLPLRIILLSPSPLFSRKVFQTKDICWTSRAIGLPKSENWDKSDMIVCKVFIEIRLDLLLEDILDQFSTAEFSPFQLKSEAPGFGGDFVFYMSILPDE